MDEERYRPAAGRVLSREEAYAFMEDQKNQRLAADQAPAANGQPEGNAESNQPRQELSQEELAALERQRAAVTPPGAPLGDRIGGAEPIIIGQAPDGGPLRLDPGLVAQARMLAIGAGLGGALVLIWWTRAQAARASVAEESSGK